MAQINKPNTHFNTKLYTGTGSSNSLTGVGFQPDWVWIKKRNGAVGHRLYDAVRGVQNTLFSDDTAAEATGQSTTLTAFNSDGFTVISESGVNASGDTYVAWNWKAGGTAVSNTDGTQTAQVSVNTTSGFSIATFPEAASYGGYISFGHGLGVAPDVVIYRQYDNASNWQVYHSALGTGKLIQLNSTGAENTGTYWGTIDSSVVNLWESLQAPTKNSVAYCFAEKKGYSKFGSYTGNGSADGTFIYTGFKPAFVLAKNSSTANRQWYIIDNKRSTSDGNNVLNKTLAPNQANDESWWGTNNYADFVSNGFKFRDSYDGFNESGGTYIYMAFAESPLVGTNNIPATAR